VSPEPGRGRTLIVVFGAAARADGSPSPTLARRIGYAAAAAEWDPATDLFCSGAAGKVGPSEASVMVRMLSGSVAASRLHADEESVDTLQSVRAAVRFFRAHGYRRCLSCTDSYHQPRIRMLFAIYGIDCRPIRLPGRGARRLRLKQRVREAAAIPYDFVAGLNARFKDRN
jgi:uncharacterized SAM-binding protein YcdF (DUF218 family)